jgi:hypothetical protein
MDAYCDKPYILTEGVEWLFPNNFILDIQLITTKYKLDSPVRLKKLSKNNSQVELIFGTYEHEVTKFTIPVSEITETLSPKYIRKPSGSLIVLGKGLYSFLIACGQADVTIYPNIPLEPSVSFEFTGPWLGVSSLKAFPEKLSKQNSPEAERPLSDVAVQRVVSGDVRFLEGFNFSVIISENKINLAATRGSGIPTDCTTSFLDEKYLDCDEIINYINGIPPDETGKFTLKAGHNINIIEGSSIDYFDDSFSERSNAHSLFVGLSFDASEICKPVNITPSLI